jgi:hypothetical protein
MLLETNYGHDLRCLLKKSYFWKMMGLKVYQFHCKSNCIFVKSIPLWTIHDSQFKAHTIVLI